MHIARQTIELGDYDRRLQFLGLAKGRGELWALFQGVAALAGLDLDKLTSGLQRLTGDELQNSLALGIQSQARSSSNATNRSRSPPQNPAAARRIIFQRRTGQEPVPMGSTDLTSCAEP